MNKRINFIGWAFIGALVVVLVGASGPIYIPAWNGGVGTNVVLVGTNRVKGILPTLVFTNSSANSWDHLSLDTDPRLHLYSSDFGGDIFSAYFGGFDVSQPIHATNGVSTYGPGSGSMTLFASNRVQLVSLVGSPTNNILVTNYLGVVHVAAASVLALDCNQSANWSQTNRATGAQTIVVTNGADGQELSMIIPGEASGGTSRVMTFIANTGQLVADEDTFGTALATSKALTLTNGNFVEMRDTVRRVNGTNVHFIATRQGAF